MLDRSIPSSARADRSVDRPRRLVVEAHYTMADGQTGVEATRYEQGIYGRPWPDTASKILTAYQTTPPKPGCRYHKIELRDVGAKVLLSEASH